MAFDAKVDELCEIYRSAGELREQDVIVYSVDEKTGMQALDRESSSMRPGKPERHDPKKNQLNLLPTTRLWGAPTALNLKRFSLF